MLRLRRVWTEPDRTRILWFDSMDAVREFAGDDYEEAYVPANPRKVLAHFDVRSKHDEVRESIWR